MKPYSTVYKGIRLKPEEKTVSDVSVTVDGVELSPEPSLELRNHSPDGFSWGYYGSGPSQLALALLLDFYNEPVIAVTYYQQFKEILVGGWQDEWMITGEDIHNYVTAFVNQSIKENK